MATKKVSKELSQNKYTILVFVIFLILFIIGWVIFGLIMPNGDENKKYGNRLDDIKEQNALITSEETAKIVSAVEGKSFVKDASTTVEGRIINVIIEVKSGTTTEKAKEISSVVLGAISDKQKKLYDVQLFIKSEDSKSTSFPIIGYKNSVDKEFTF